MTYMSTHILPVAKTTTYGLKSTSYIAAKAGNALPDDLRSVAEFARFRKELRTFALIVSAHPYCARKSTCHAMPRHVSSARAKCYFEQ